MSYNNYKSSQRGSRAPRTDRRYQNNGAHNSGGYRNSQYDNKNSNYSNYSSSNYGSTQARNYHHNKSHTASTYNQNFETTQIWMGDLDPSWTEQEIIQIWKQEGLTPISVRLIKGDTNWKPAHCFIKFPSSSDVNRAVLKNGSPIHGTKAYFKLNKAQERNFNASTSSPIPTVNYTGPESLFVGDLATDVTDNDLYQAFAKVYSNEVKSVKVMKDLHTKNSKGYGFVKLSSVELATKALKEMNGVKVKNKSIRLGPVVKSQNSVTSNSQTRKEVEVGRSKTSSSDTGPLVDTQTQAQSHTIVYNTPLNPQTDPNNNIVIVKGLSGRFNEREIENMLISFGDILKIEFSPNGDEALIKFYLRSAAESAIFALNKLEVKGYRLTVNWGKNFDKPFTKSVPAPPTYGVFDMNSYVNLSKKQLCDIQISDKSEPIPITRANDIYLERKIKNLNIFNY